VGLVFGAGLFTLIGVDTGFRDERERVLFLAPDLTQSRSFTVNPFVASNRKSLAATVRF
jgi:hypothetical protein